MTAAHGLGQRLLFGTAVTLVVALELMALVNVFMWRRAPDFGWIPSPALGGDVVGFTTAWGQTSGLRWGDRILSINGQTFTTADERNALIDFEIGGVTTYSIVREAKPLTVRVTTQEVGLRRALYQSGVIWLVGAVFASLGILVFLMKPYVSASWAFLTMTLLAGPFISYASPTYFYRPDWLHSVSILALPLVPAGVLHLAVAFPQERRLFSKRPWLIAVFYLLSFGLAILSRSYGPRSPYVPYWLQLASYAYLALALLVFAASTFQSYFRGRTVAVRLQSLVILTGILIALMIPVFQNLTVLLFRISLFTNLIVTYLALFLFFPASIGYAIVRHDLFEISTLVRRTYGYLLSTATVISAYAVVVLLLNLTVGPTAASESRVFPLAFSLGVVFTFQPLHRRSQSFVDRVFYRRTYDYRKTIMDVSEAMTTILDPSVIQRTLLGSVVREMSLENGVLLLPDGQSGSFEVQGVESGDDELKIPQRLESVNRLSKRLRDEGRAVFRHDIDVDPRYAPERELLEETFQRFDSSVFIPMTLKDELKGILSLGSKKSGRMFTAEDLDLLRTMVNQSVIALENGRLFDDLAASLKENQILESIKSHLSKFVPKTVQDLIEESPEAPSLEKRETDLSVLFCDITGYTLMSAKLPLDKVNSLVERYFGAFLDEIIAQGGDVNETAGDGLMVLFRDEDPTKHARAALRAGLRIQYRTVEINAERVSEQYPIEMHVGINSGTAAVGATKIEGLGSTRYTYTASGPTTNIAARLAAKGEAEMVIVSEETRSRLGDEFDFDDLGPQSLKNVEQPMRAYRIWAAKASRGL
jgi:class 3 adenylate cyclase